MPCYHPMKAYRSRQGRNESGAWPITFKISEGYADMELDIPCGQCVGCRLEYARNWAIRGCHELKDHKYACYMTLTYDDENLPGAGNLDPYNMVNFIKRLRHFADPMKIRYLQCGEYGDLDKRPHHHMILYGYEFPDCKFFKMHKGNKLYVSKIANKLWGNGFVTIGAVTFDSICYVARYVLKKAKKEDDPDRVPEYITMSRNPGLGMNHLDKYMEEIYETDSVVVAGKEFKPPKVYDLRLKDERKNLYEKIKNARKLCVTVKSEEQLRAGEKIAINKMKGSRA